MKNENGFGSVYKLKNKKRNQWTACVTLGWVQIYNNSGTPVRAKQKRIRLGYYPTRKEAQLALAKWHEEHPQNATQATKTPFLASSVVQLGNYAPTLKQLWNSRKTSLEKGIALTTQKAHASFFKLLVPLHDKRIDEIGYRELQALFDSYSDKYKENTISSIKGFLSLLFGEAVKLGYITSSPTQYVKIRSSIQKKKKKIFDTELIKRIAIEDTKISSITIVLLYTGLRINELLKLTPANCHFEEDYIITGSKTKAGKDRVVPVHPAIKDKLIELVPHLKGKGFSPDNIRIAMSKEYGYTPHECRHTFITMCHQYGIDTYTEHKIVGHATNDVSEMVYTHIQIETMYREICKIPYPKDLK